MVLKYNLARPERKNLARAIGEIRGGGYRYMGAPSFAYQAGGFTVDMDSAVTPTADLPNPDTETRKLAEALLERGFTPERMPEATREATDAPQAAVLSEEASQPPEAGETPREAPVAETCGFCVELPRAGITDNALENLRKLVDSKAGLIRKAIGADSLDITADAERIFFPWFDAAPEPEVASATTMFISRLLDTARTQKRVTARERVVNNEKYAFRCFLLRLGFIGPEYKTDRKTLLRNLTGSAAFKDGDRRGKNGQTEEG